jgi:hypothetical protein
MPIFTKISCWTSLLGKKSGVEINSTPAESTRGNGCKIGRGTDPWGAWSAPLRRSTLRSSRPHLNAEEHWLHEEMAKDLLTRN